MFTVNRSKNNPLISPVHNQSWEEVSTCNGCPIIDPRKNGTGDGSIFCLYRAIAPPDKMSPAHDLTLSTIGATFSSDGISGEHFTNHMHFIKPEMEWEKYGCEDPRITFFEGKYYTFYTALSNYPLTADGIKVALAIHETLPTPENNSKNHIGHCEKHLVTPFNAKAMALFPERINGKVAVILTANTDKPPAEISIRLLDSIEDLWNEEKWRTWYSELSNWHLPLRRNEKDHVEAGAPPIKTDKGWLIIYAHIQNYFSADKVFGIEAVLLDLNDPKKIIGRTTHPFLIPEEIYEKYGYIPNIVFPTGALVKELGGVKILEVYYGASDTTTCKASLKLNDLLDSMLPEKRMAHLHRSVKNPHLKLIAEHAWEARSVFNPSAIDIDGIVRIAYRAMSKDGTSYIGYAESKDGESIDYRHPEPIYIPRADFELKKGDPNGNSGCEDPRLTQIGDRIYVTYTAYDGVHAPRVATSSILVSDFISRDTKRMRNWSMPVCLTPENIDDKDACFLSEKIDDKYIFMHRVGHCICMDYMPDLNFTPGEVNTCIEVMEPRLGMWDGAKIGISSPPHKTDKGWLLLYHGIDSHGVYRVGAALLDLADPSHVLARTADPIFEPEAEYEKVGEIPNVVFPCGSVIRGDTMYIYYGGADMVCGVAMISVSKLLSSLT